MHIKVNWWAILVSDIVLFFLGWLWYDVFFGRVWLAALREVTPQVSMGFTWYAFVVSLVGGFFLAYGLALILKWRGAVGPLEGAWIGFAFGLLIFGTMTWMDYVYSGWGAALGFINTGFVSVGMGVMGAILAAWKPRGA